MARILKKDSTEQLARKAAAAADEARISLICGREHCMDVRYSFGGDYYWGAIRQLEDALQLANAAHTKALDETAAHKAKKEQS